MFVILYRGKGKGCITGCWIVVIGTSRRHTLHFIQKKHGLFLLSVNGAGDIQWTHSEGVNVWVEPLLKDSLRRDHLRSLRLRRDHLRRDDVMRDHQRRGDMMRDCLGRDNMMTNHLRRDYMRRDCLRRDGIRSDHMRRDDMRKDDMMKDVPSFRMTFFLTPYPSYYM